MTTYPLWEGKAPGAETEVPSVDCYLPDRKTTDAAIVIFPGGAYSGRAPHEGGAFAEFFAALGMTAFVVAYRVFPAHFPDPLLDARRAVRFVRANAEKFGIDPAKVVAIGSSAGGHLTAFLSTYREKIEGEGADAIDDLDPFPNLQVLCYPVISSDEAISHKGSYQNLLGDRYGEREIFSPELLVTRETPPAFLWHTAEDSAVSVENSYRYATALKVAGIPCEMHIFPFGPHGRGLAVREPHVAQWRPLIRNWLILNGYLPEEA